MSSTFFHFHPGNDLGYQLFANRFSIRKSLESHPVETIQYLVNNFSFGRKSDFWDDHIFNTVISPVLDNFSQLDLKTAINWYSNLDHALFRTYIRRDEDPIRFRRAFWNVNSFGIQLSKRFHDSVASKFDIVTDTSFDDEKKSIAFVFKGGFHLAHAEFFREFLVGTKFFSSRVDISVILIDAPKSSINIAGLEHIKIHSFSQVEDTYSKLIAYFELTNLSKYMHICWVACVQNLTLYMGSQFAQSQGYWSMKYHSIIMRSLDKYAGLGFGGKSFNFDGIEWFRGRAFPDLTLPVLDISQRQKLRSENHIPINSFLAGCFVRTEKLNNYDFWVVLEKLFILHPDFHYVIASQGLPEISKSFMDKNVFIKRFHHIGWVDTKKWCQCLDLYLDSFPRGSCLTALEAVQAGVPTVIFETPHNRESSALPYLASANGKATPAGCLPCESVDQIVGDLVQIISSPSSLKTLADEQLRLIRILSGRSPLFAKDYLNFFLDTNYSVNRGE